MCVVSFVGQHYEDEFNKKPYKPWKYDPPTPAWPPAQYAVKEPSNTELKKQIDELRIQVLEMKQFLKEAIEYDKLYKQPGCENDLKIAFLKKVAKSVGVTLEDIFPAEVVEPTPPASRIEKESKIPKRPKK